MTSAMQGKDALRIVVAAVVLVIIVIVFAVTVGFFMHYCPVIKQGEVLTTDKTCYKEGEEVVITLENVWDKPIDYDSELRDTLEVYGPDGKLLVMVPMEQTSEVITLNPNETLEWTWDQTYYLWDVDEHGNATLDDRNGDQVPLGSCVVRIAFGEIEKEAKFKITP